MRYSTYEEQLFAHIREGDKKAFDTFFLRYYPVLCAYATSFVREDEAEETIQDIMVWIWENRENIEIESSLSKYLFRAVRNKCVNHITKKRLHEHIHTAIAGRLYSQFEDPDFYIVEELTQKIEEALGKLPETYRKAFVMNRMENKTYNEIAVILGVSAKTVDYRIQQALKNLRMELKDYLPLLLSLFNL